MLEEDLAAAGLDLYLADLQRIGAAGRHLLALINDVLDLSRIEAGRLQIHLEPINVAAVVEEVAGTVEPLARGNNNVFHVRQDGRNVTVYADATRLRQALLNLLSDACKFTENGAVTLEVGQERSGGRDWICFHVIDTGIGIAPEQQVIDEGVETEEQLEWLKALGCDFVQGHLFSKPLDKAQVRAVLAEAENRNSAADERR
jgi:signal transduction histidine kinase